MPIPTPIAAPAQGPTPAGTNVQTAQAARAAAIAAFNQSSRVAEQPVPNANQVSPEELGAIKSPSQGQADIGVEASEPKEEELKSPPVKEEPALSSQYAVLARREKALRVKMQAQDAASKAAEVAMAAREAAIKAKEAEYQANYVPKDRLTNDTWNTLSELGISYDQITQMALNPPPQESPASKLAFQKLQAEIQALKDSQENSQKTAQEHQSNQYKQAVNQIRSEVKTLVSSDPAYETIAATGSAEDVVELIEKTFKADGILLTVEEAALAVEDHLMEEAMKITRIKKIQERLRPTAQAAPKQQDSAPKQPQPMKTLTNAVSSSRQLTAKERAILAFKGQLKD